VNYEKMSREELIALLVSMVAARSTEAAAADDATRLLHDLQVHQIELEMQNRELRETHGELESSRNRYADLYDFAPMAYFTLDERGLVHELNLSAANLLGLERDRIVGRPLTSAMKFSDPAAFWRHLGRCAASQSATVTEFHVQVGERSYDVEAISVVTSGLEATLQAKLFRTAFVDNTARKRAEAELGRAYASEQTLRAQLVAVDRAYSELSSVLAKGSEHRVAELADAILRHAMALTRSHRTELQLVDGVDFGPEIPRRYSGGRSMPFACASVSTTLSFGGRALAVLRAYRVEAAQNDLSPAVERTLEMYGERIASVLEVARLQTLDRRERERLATLDRISRDLESAQTVAEVERALAEVARHTVPSIARACSVHVFRGEQLKLVGWQHVDPEKRARLTLVLGEPRGDVERAFRKLAELPEARAFFSDATESAAPEAPWGAERSTLLKVFDGPLLIVAPLLSRGRCLGLLCFDDKLEQSGEGAGDTLQAPVRDKLEDALVRARAVAARCAASLSINLVEQLQEAVRWRESVMAAVSHDLRSPLNTIAMGANAISEHHEVEGNSGGKYMDLIQRSVNHMDSMISDLVTMSSLEAGAFQVETHAMPAKELLQEACDVAQLLVSKKSIHFECAVAADLPTVVADPARILRVFGNLIGNAVKYTPAGGTVHVDAATRADGVTFSVSDSGTGIAEGDRSHIFERFWRKNLRERGLGLGLYIARSIVEAHGGKIWVETASLGGAKICFDLPSSN
jgi:PAS domain S-box-containing protein